MRLKQRIDIFLKLVDIRKALDIYFERVNVSEELKDTFALAILEKYEKIRRKIHDDAISRGGKISGEHGIGVVKKEYMNIFTDNTLLKLMKDIKKSFDPNNILNPGKIFDL